MVSGKEASVYILASDTSAADFWLRGSFSDWASTASGGRVHHLKADDKAHVGYAA